MKLWPLFQDWLVRKIAPRIPRLQRLGRRLEAATYVAKQDREEIRAMAEDLSLRKAEVEERLRQVKELRMAEEWCRTPDREIRQRGMQLLPESDRSEVNTDVVIKERLWELELALEDRGWVRETTLAALEFSRYGVGQLIRICRIYGIKNPLIKRIAEICKLYVFGRGFEIRSEDPAINKIVQSYLEDNDAELGHVGLAEKETEFQTDGALYFGLATSAGKVKVIMIDPLEIMDVITDPDDSARPQFFKRSWNRLRLDIPSGIQVPEAIIAWYPALEYLQSKPKSKPPRIGPYAVNWDMPVQRIKGGCPAKWRWGVPLVYAALDSARAYLDALQDYATVRRTLARFALMVETKGGPGTIAAYQALLSTTFADNNGTQIERNPPPVVGSAHVGGPGTSIGAFKSSGAQSNPEELRRILLLACSSSGMPETFFGDASTGSLATAVSLDRPTELKFSDIQRRWSHAIKQQLVYAIQVSQGTPGAMLYNAMREAKKAKIAAPGAKGLQLIVKFPTVVEHEILPMMQAIIEMGTGGGRNGIFAGILDRKTILDLCLAEIGYENRTELLDSIFGKNYDPAEDVTDQRSQVPPQSLSTATGKALTDLSIPPPLPPPPPPPAPLPPKPGDPNPPAPVAPPAPKPVAKTAAPKAKTAKAKKEALDRTLVDIREALAGLKTKSPYVVPLGLEPNGTKSHTLVMETLTDKKEGWVTIDGDHVLLPDGGTGSKSGASDSKEERVARLAAGWHERNKTNPNDPAKHAKALDYAHTQIAREKEEAEKAERANRLAAKVRAEQETEDKASAEQYAQSQARKSRIDKGTY